MSLADLHEVLGVYRSTVDDIPADATVRAYLMQSMVLGVDGTVQTITKTNTWSTALPVLKGVLSDIPVEENVEIAAQIFNVLEEMYPDMVQALTKSPKKVAHVSGIVSQLIKEIRNATD